MKRALAGLALALAALGLRDEHAPAKLIDTPLLVNGSFEDGPDLGEATFKALNENSQEIRGWTVTRGQIDWIGTHWQHAHGKRSIDLHGSPGIGGVKQTFATKRGQKYRVTLALSGNPQANVGPVNKAITVRAAGEHADFNFDTTGRNEKDMGWLYYSWDFFADADETTLEIHSRMSEGPFGGPAIDNVSVTSVK